MLRSQFIALALALALAPICAQAHTTKLSSAQITLTGHGAETTLLVNGADLEAAIGATLTDASAQVSPARLQASQATITDYVAARARISNSAGATCSYSRRTLIAEAEHVKLTLSWKCPPMTGTLIYRSTLFNELDPATRQMVTVRGDATRLALLSVASPQIVLASTTASWSTVFVHYLIAGVEHIAIGYDHIAFLVAVILWGRRLWPLVGVITAFTLAHSITLSLAVLEVVSPPPQWVEIAIALSIVYVAAENFFVRDLRRRWMITVAFGLVLGFGFAGVLREYGIPRDALAPALAAFNIGVELGQLAIVVAALLALRVLETQIRVLRPAPSPRLVYPISAVVLGLGLYWTALRVIWR
jgi:hydrogenase/urease accessory protein HupE